MGAAKQVHPTNRSASSMLMSISRAVQPRSRRLLKFLAGCAVDAHKICLLTSTSLLLHLQPSRVVLARLVNLLAVELAGQRQVWILAVAQLLKHILLPGQIHANPEFYLRGVNGREQTTLGRQDGLAHVGAALEVEPVCAIPP